MSNRKVVPTFRYLGGKAQFFSTIVKYFLNYGRKFINLLACKYPWEILIPEKDKKQIPFTGDHHSPFYAEVRKVSGGFTSCPGAYGEWVDKQGAVCPDDIIAVRFTSSRADANRIAKYAQKHYDQDLIMAYPLAKKRNFIFAERQEKAEGA